MDIQGLSPILLAVAELKSEKIQIMERYGHNYSNYPKAELHRLRVIDDTVHSLKQQALKLMGF